MSFEQGLMFFNELYLKHPSKALLFTSQKYFYLKKPFMKQTFHVEIAKNMCYNMTEVTNMSSILYSDKLLNAFFKGQLNIQNEIHSIEIYEKGNILLRASQKPYECDDKRELYSLSKTFTSTSIGIAQDLGLLDVEERIVDIFPDKCPETISENLGKMKIKHLLSMNTGHRACVMPKMYSADDCAKAFLEQAVDFEPGTHFTYNTGATCMLGAILEKRAKMSLYDFAEKYLLCPLGIEGSHWNTVKDGTAEAGIGFHASCDDILKLGILYLNKGEYNGKRIVSEKWVKEASFPHSNNNGNGNPDWCAGYGYQIWMNDKEGYRGDGAFGQLCMVLPERDMVVAVMANCVDMQKEIDGVFDLINGNLTADEEENNGFATLGKSQKKNYPFIGKKIPLKDNDIGFESVTVDYEGDNLRLSFFDGKDEKVILAGNGEYVKSSYTAKWRKPKLVGMMRADFEETINTAACYKASNDGLELFVRVLSCPNCEIIKIYENDGKLNIDFLCEELRNLFYDGAKKLVEG